MKERATIFVLMLLTYFAFGLVENVEDEEMLITGNEEDEDNSTDVIYTTGSDDTRETSTVSKRSSRRVGEACTQLEKFASNMCAYTDVRSKCRTICRRGRRQRMSCGQKYDSNGRPIPANKRIMGGKDSRQGEWNWQVSLKGTSADGVVLCGAAILSENFLLSAAHCFRSIPNPSNWAASAGDHDRSVTENFEKTHDFKKIIPHPDYNEETKSNDIAIVQLKTRINMRSNKGRICLPLHSHPIPDNQECYITGWGRTRHNGQSSNILKHVKVLTMSHDACKSRENWGGNIDNTMLCAGIARQRKGSCRGDSGGSLACKISGYWHTAGVVSYGYHHCNANSKPSVFANVTYFKEWITKTILNDSAEF